MKQVMSEARLVLFLKNGKTFRKAPIMEYVNFFTENLWSTALDFVVSEDELFWKL